MAVGCKIIRDFPRPARELVERFRGVATSNLVDVMGSCAAIDGALAPIGRGRLLGTAFPVRLPQGDNLMLHAAIDLAQPGDVLVLTKPLGSGVLTTAIKADLISPAARDAVYAHMATLNKKAGNAVRSAKNIHACTDVTGFGLLGHSYEMASGSGVTIRLHGATLPLMDEARDMAEMGIIPAGAYRNMDYVKPHLTVLPTAQQVSLDLAADPQTSGGLLVALPREDAEPLLRELQTFAPWSAIVGEESELRATALEFD